MRALVTATTAAAAFGLMFGSALAQTQTYDVPAFTGVDISSGVAAVVEAGTAQSVTAQAPTGAALERLAVEVRDGVLHVHLDQNLLEGLFTLWQSPQITVRVTAPNLQSAVSSAGSNVDVKGLAGTAVKLEASSGSSLAATDVAGGRIDAEASSGARLTVSGSCETLVADSSSGATLDAEALACPTVTVDASSGAKASVTATTDVNVASSTGAHVDVHGNPRPSGMDSNTGGSVSFVN